MFAQIIMDIFSLLLSFVIQLLQNPEGKNRYAFDNTAKSVFGGTKGLSLSGGNVTFATLISLFLTVFSNSMTDFDTPLFIENFMRVYGSVRHS